ncbi:hypothetical protein L2E82_07944 [Cichorium intybus]|uniref:Uncharacterized protein n=1 Tax=Cichorium intybus TaxID=13427 RepID=A0ACB9G5S4_CICIN|nr:hypothetical protein L2E82_07944 [Cichorium intybus]
MYVPRTPSTMEAFHLDTPIYAFSQLSPLLSWDSYVSIANAIEDANGGLESASATVEAEETLKKDENDSNGVDSSDSVELDGSVDTVQGVADKFLLHHHAYTTYHLTHLPPRLHHSRHLFSHLHHRLLLTLNQVQNHTLHTLHQLYLDLLQDIHSSKGQQGPSRTTCGEKSIYSM